jgi:hypothetical protein
MCARSNISRSSTSTWAITCSLKAHVLNIAFYGISLVIHPPYCLGTGHAHLYDTQFLFL